MWTIPVQKLSCEIVNTTQHNVNLTKQYALLKRVNATEYGKH